MSEKLTFDPNNQVETEQQQPTEAQEKRRTRYISVMKTLDLVRFMPYLGKEGAKTFTRLSSAFREEDIPYDRNRLLGIGRFVDKEERRELFSFIDSVDDETLHKLVKLAGGLHPNELFEYGYITHKNDLPKFAEDPEALNLAVQIAPSNVFKHVSDDRPTYQAGLYTLVTEVSDLLIDRSTYKADPAIIERLLEEARLFFPHDLAPVLNLAHFEWAYNQIKDRKPPMGESLPLFECASLDPNLIEELEKYIAGLDDDSHILLKIEAVNIFIKNAENVKDPILKNLLTRSRGVLSKHIYPHYDWSKSRARAVFEAVSFVTAKLRRKGIDPNIVTDYLNSFPMKEFTLEEIGSIASDNNHVLESLAELDEDIPVGKILEVYGDKSFLIFYVAQAFSISEETSFAIELNKATESLSDVLKDPDKIEFLEKIWTEVVKYLNLHPENVDTIIQLIRNEDIRRSIAPGGILSDASNIFLQDIFQSSDPYTRGKEIINSFTSPKTPYWEKVFYFASQSNTQYLYRVILPGVESDIEMIKEGLKESLRVAVEDTRSKEKKEEADARNRKLAKTNQLSRIGVRLHGTGIDNLPRILRSGNFSGECVVKVNKIDSYPFFVDFAVVKEEDVKASRSNFSEILRKKTDKYNNYFTKGVVFIHEPDEQAQPTYEESDHVLKFAAEPATTATGVVINSEGVSNKQVEELKIWIAENGFYIPIYSKEGELVFPDSEYDKLIREGHLDRDLEYWDTTLQIGGPLGSNPGGIFLVPEEGGPTRYYVKQNERERVWNEWLACKFYEDFGLAVPEVGVRNVDGHVAFTSKWIESTVGNKSSEIDQTTLNSGALMDMWMANWDIPWAEERNTLNINGTVVRLDNGGALLFSATGARKVDGESGRSFSGEVIEVLDSIAGTRGRSGVGMINEYPGLTEEQLIEQARRIESVFTDEHIEKRVEETQISAEDRVLLIDTLKKRRDFLLGRYGI